MVRVEQENKEGEFTRQEYHEADSFGISPSGVLILVKIIDLPPGVPPGQVPQGENLKAINSQFWKSAEVVKSNIQTANLPRGIRVRQ